jgi:hypothetical protein
MKPIFRSLLLVAALLVPTHRLWSADSRFTPPASPRVTYNFNAGWKFMRAEVPGAQEVSFDDSKWETVSTPHTFNDVDSFRVIIDHSGGDRGTYKGISWYRKHFKLPADAAGSKVFIEFEGMRQAGEIYLNGRPFGLYENGVTAYGVDAKGERCPTDDARVDFTMDATSTVGTSPAIWRGGYNSGKTNTTNNLYLNTEDGINRVAIRSTLTPGTIKVTATRDGLKPATVTFTSSPVAITDGLSQEVQVTLSPFATK